MMTLAHGERVVETMAEWSSGDIHDVIKGVRMIEVYVKDSHSALQDLLAVELKLVHLMEQLIAPQGLKIEVPDVDPGPFVDDFGP